MKSSKRLSKMSVEDMANKLIEKVNIMFYATGKAGKTYLTESILDVVRKEKPEMKICYLHEKISENDQSNLFLNLNSQCNILIVNSDKIKEKILEWKERYLEWKTYRDNLYLFEGIKLVDRGHRNREDIENILKGMHGQILIVSLVLTFEQNMLHLVKAEFTSLQPTRKSQFSSWLLLMLDREDFDKFKKKKEISLGYYELPLPEDTTAE